MNLLTSKWIPVELDSGKVEVLAIGDIPCSGGLRVAHPRPDFSALITELLVTVLQSLAAPANKRERSQRITQPENFDMSWISVNAPFFELFGESSRFLQSPTPLGSREGPGSLVYEAPGANTAEKNTDFFVSRNAIQKVCPCCATAGLFLNQAHARVGGKGYYTTRRKSSPLTVLLEAPTLWETLNLNVLPRDTYEQKYCYEQGQGYPWTNGEGMFTREVCGPNETGPHAGLWWMPLALYLHESANPSGEPCSLCGEVSPIVVTAVSRTATKSRPSSSFEHPLTIWSDNPKSGESFPLEVPAEGFLLDEWFALLLGVSPKASYKGCLPAISLLPISRAPHCRLWLFGKAMNKNSLSFDYEERAPLLCSGSIENSETLAKYAKLLGDELLKVFKVLQGALNENLSDAPKSKSKIPVPLNQPPTQVLAAFAAQSRDYALKVLAPLAISSSDAPEPVPLTKDTLDQFSVDLRKLAAKLFDSALVVSHLEYAFLQKVLRHQAKFNKSLFPKITNKSSSKK